MVIENGTKIVATAFGTLYETGDSRNQHAVGVYKGDVLTVIGVGYDKYREPIAQLRNEQSGDNCVTLSFPSIKAGMHRFLRLMSPLELLAMQAEATAEV